MIGDVFSDSVVVKGTKYEKENIVVMKVLSQELIKVGVIKAVVAREETLLFVVSVHDCVRHRFRFFEALPLDQALLINFTSLEDYKPLIQRGKAECFKFFLHHHLPLKNH